MAKTKTPFLSLASQGSVGGSITTQRHGRDTIVKTKPRPAYRLTLPQFYQRFLYRYYAHSWTLQSTATKQTYATAGVRLHLTGFQNWMRYHLIFMPDIIAIYYLDDNIGATTPDNSGKENTLTVFGASPADGVISGCFSFDGSNDYLRAASALIPRNDFTLLATIDHGPGPWPSGIITQYQVAQPGRAAWRISRATDKQEFFIEGQEVQSDSTVSTGWRRLAIRRATNTFTFFKGGIADGGGVITNLPSASILTGIGGLYNPWPGLIDHVWLIDRALADTEIALFADLAYEPAAPSL